MQLYDDNWQMYDSNDERIQKDKHGLFIEIAGCPKTRLSTWKEVIEVLEKRMPERIQLNGTAISSHTLGVTKEEFLQLIPFRYKETSEIISPQRLRESEVFKVNEKYFLKDRNGSKQILSSGQYLARLQKPNITPPNVTTTTSSGAFYYSAPSQTNLNMFVRPAETPAPVSQNWRELMSQRTNAVVKNVSESLFVKAPSVQASSVQVPPVQVAPVQLPPVQVTSAQVAPAQVTPIVIKREPSPFINTTASISPFNEVPSWPSIEDDLPFIKVEDLPQFPSEETMTTSITYSTTNTQTGRQDNSNNTYWYLLPETISPKVDKNITDPTGKVLGIKYIDFSCPSAAIAEKLAKDFLHFIINNARIRGVDNISSYHYDINGTDPTKVSIYFSTRTDKECLLAYKTIRDAILNSVKLSSSQLGKQKRDDDDDWNNNNNLKRRRT